MADLRTIAQQATNPQTGEYLSPEQRKLLFKKGRMGSKVDPSAFLGRSGAIVKVVKPPKTEEGPGGALVKQEDTVGSKEVQDEFESIKYTFVKVLKTKKEKERLRSKYYDLLGKTKSKPSIPPPDDDGGMDLGLGRKMKNKAVGFFGGLLGALGDIIAFAALDWIGNPKNRATVETFVKVFQSLFNFFNWYIGALIDNILGGFAMLVGGDSLLERIGGFLKLTAGIFGLRYLSVKGPVRLTKDLKFLFKNIGKFKNFFQSLIKLDGKGMKTALEAGVKGLLKVFRKNLARGITRFLIKLFGKAFAKGAKAFAKFAIKKGLGLIGKFPIIGPILQFGFSLAMGEPLGKAAFKTLGSIFLGGIGTAVGGPVGWAIGGLVGDWAGGVLYDAFFGGKEKKDSEETPEMSVGGIASGPKTGYLVMLHGTEVVIPINKIGEILGTPFAALGSGIIGGIFAVINSLGPVSNFVRPIAVSVLGPQLRLFGMEKYTHETTVGDIQGDPEIISKKIEKKKEDKDTEDLFGKDFLKNIGMILMLAGGSIFGGGAARAGTMDESGGSYEGSGDNSESGTLAPIDLGNDEYGEQPLIRAAKKAGYKDKELAAFLAQMAHESGNFRYKHEIGGGKDSYSGGKKYHGRGYIQLTHDYNYSYYGKKLGIDLLNNPDLAASGDVAAQIAVLYWNENVRPTVKGNWDNVFLHSKAINYPAATRPSQVNGMSDRQKKYDYYVKKVASSNFETKSNQPISSPASPSSSPTLSQPQQIAGLTLPTPTPPPQMPRFAGSPRAASMLFDMSSENSINKKLQSRQASSVPSSIFSYNNTQLNTRMNINNMSLNSTSISNTQVLNRL